MSDAPIIAIFGDPASGKSHWRRKIAAHLGWSSYDIAKFGEVGAERWPALIRRLAADPAPAVVESCVSPPAYRAVLNRRPSLIVHIIAPREVRLQRLKERHLEARLERKLLRISRKPPRQPDLTIEHGAAAERVLACLDSALQSFPTQPPHTPSQGAMTEPLSAGAAARADSEIQA